MTNLPAPIDNKGQLAPSWLKSLPARARRLVTAIGPLVVSQSERASELYQRHKIREADVEIYKARQIDESRVLNELRAKLFEKFVAADDLERLKLEAAIKTLDEKQRRSDVCTLALQHLSSEGDPAPEADDKAPIAAEWLDRWDEIARKNNEPWRQEVLAKALVRESEKPGSIGTRALWIVGTLEEMPFHAFSIILDLCTLINLRPMIPGRYGGDEVIQNSALPGASIGSLLYHLADVGLLADSNAGQKAIGTMYACYHEERYVLEFQSQHRITGVILSNLGQRVASLYEPKFNPLGAKLFSEWIDSLSPHITKRQLTPDVTVVVDTES